MVLVITTGNVASASALETLSKILRSATIRSIVLNACSGVTLVDGAIQAITFCKLLLTLFCSASVKSLYAMFVLPR